MVYHYNVWGRGGKEVGGSIQIELGLVMVCPLQTRVHFAHKRIHCSYSIFPPPPPPPSPP